VQAALVAELRQLLQELGTGFAIVGERSPLVVGDSEFFPDLLCYHTRLHRYVVFELKLGRFDPRDLGQLQFYVQAVDHQVRDELIDAATIGVLLVADHDDTVVQYALQASTAPVAVSRYELPEDVRASMPADEVLIAVGRDVTLNWTKNAGVTSRDNRDCWVHTTPGDHRRTPAKRWRASRKCGYSPQDIQSSTWCSTTASSAQRARTLSIPSCSSAACWVRSSECPCDAGFRIALMHALPSTTAAFILILSVCLRW